MKLKILKKVRVMVSLTFFLLIVFVFLDFSFSISENIADFVIYFQFIPSLLKFLLFGALATAGSIFIIGFTLIFGRVYCSFFCPMGVLQDIFAYIPKKTEYGYSVSHLKTRYSILITVVSIYFSGSIIGLILLDPYSNFGRILTHMVRPVAIAINNALVFALAKINVYSIYPVEFKGINLSSFIFSMAIFGLILFMSLKYGRLYCNTICPVGTFLGFLSRYSLFKIKLNPSACIKCKACEKVCKSSCIDLHNERIDFSRCVACYNCFKVCPVSGVEYQLTLKKTKPKHLEKTGKRDFIIQTASFLLASASSAIGAQQQVEFYKNSTVPVFRKTGITPPGSLSLENFMSKCTACHLCVSACPTRVLQPSFLEYGLMGIMQPRMDYKISYCNYDCVICTNVCPSGAILKQSLENKKLIQLGKAKFIQKNCVVYTHKTDCGACAEHCPTKAVRMVLDKKINKRTPKIDENICVGCGACEFACPTKPYKAIYVENNPVHLKAKKPKEEEITEEIDLKESFPF